MRSRRVPATVVSFSQEERDAVMRVLDSGRVVQGPEVAAFESEFSQLVAGRWCVAVNSGTSALHLGLLAAGIGPGDEVVVPSFSFAASANAVAITGATPVFADIDPETFTLAPDAAAAAVGPRTAAVMPVHLYGQPADTHALSALTDRHGLLLIEDAAQAVGSSLVGTPAGALGDVAAFSFYATKNLSTGEGGMVVCRDDETARRVRLLRNQGMERQYHNEIAGLNNRMTELAAAIGRVQLGRLAGWTARRQQVAAAYDELADVVTTPRLLDGATHVFHQYTVRTPRRDDVMAHLDARGVEARVFYPVPIHRLPAYRADVDLPTTEATVREVLSLPVRPSLDDGDVAHVVASVREAVAAVS